MVYYVVIFLNCSVAKNGVSDTLSLREIILSQNLDLIKHCRSNGEPLEFGEYLEVHENLDIPTTPQSCTFPAIYLDPNTNIQGTN